LGATTRGTKDASGQAVAVVVTRPLSTDATQQTAFLTAQAASMSTIVARKNPAAIITHVASLSSAMLPPCHAVKCGLHGTCDESTGACVCKAGWEGQLCAVVSAVNGEWSAWGAWSPCSASCGGGVRQRTRRCVGQAGAGAACGLPTEAIQTETCGSTACTGVVAGGWSAWSEWGECDAQCPDDVGGLFPGEQTRSRSCTNPPPSASPVGLPCVGLADETRLCNVEQCPWPPKDCPGTVRNAVTGAVEVECFGRGTCVHTPVGQECADAFDDCDAVCVCAEGYAGPGCSLGASAYADYVTLVGDMVAAAGLAVDLVDRHPAALTAAGNLLADVASHSASMPDDALIDLASMVAAQAALARGPATAAQGGGGVEAVLGGSIGGTANAAMGLTDEAATSLVSALSNIASNTVEARVRACAGAEPACDTELPAALSLSIASAADAVVDALLSDMTISEAARSVSSGQLIVTVHRQDPNEGLRPVALPTGGSISFPAQLSARLANEGTGEDDTLQNLAPGDVSVGVDIRVVAWLRGRTDLRFEPDVTVGTSLQPAFVSGVLDASLSRPASSSRRRLDEAEPIVVANLTKPIVFTLPLRQTLLAARAREGGSGSDTRVDDEPKCTYYDDEANAWSNQGTVSLGTSDNDQQPGGRLLVCGTRHLTAFGSVSAVDPATLNIPTPFLSLGELQRALDPSNVLIVVVVAALIGCGCGMWSYLGERERRRRHEIRAARRAKFLMTGTVEPGNDIDDIDVQLDEAGKAVRTAGKMGNIVDLAINGSLSLKARMNQSFKTPALLRGIVVDEKSARAKKSWWRTLLVAYGRRLRRTHQWIATIAPPTDDLIRYSRPQRVLVLLAGCFTALTVNAVFFGKSGSSVDARLLVGVIAGLCKVPTDMIFPRMFKSMNSLKSSTVDVKVAIHRAHKKELQLGMSQKGKLVRVPTAENAPKNGWFSSSVLGTSDGGRSEAPSPAAVVDVAAGSPAPAKAAVSSRPAIKARVKPRQPAAHEEKDMFLEDADMGDLVSRLYMAASAERVEPDDDDDFGSAASRDNGSALKLDGGLRPARAVTPTNPTPKSTPGSVRPDSDALGYAPVRTNGLRVANRAMAKPAASKLSPTPEDAVMRLPVMRSGALGWARGVRKPPRSSLLIVGIAPNIALAASAVFSLLSGLVSFTLTAYGKATGVFLLSSSVVLTALAVAGLALSLAYRPRLAMVVGLCGVFAFGGASGLLAAMVSGKDSRGEGMWEAEWESMYRDERATVRRALAVTQDEHACCGFFAPGDRQVESALCGADSTIEVGCVGVVGDLMTESTFILLGVTWGALLIGFVAVAWKAVAALRAPLPPYADVLQLAPPGSHMRAKQQMCAVKIQAIVRGGMSRTAFVRAVEMDQWEWMSGRRRMGLSLVYGVVLGYTLFLAWVNLVFGIKFTSSQMDSWLYSCGVSLALDIIFTKPIAIFVRTVAMLLAHHTRVKTKEAVLEVRRYAGFASLKGVVPGATPRAAAIF